MPVEGDGERDRPGTSERPEGTPSALDPEETLGIIANRTRLRVIDTLWGSEEPDPMRFWELRKAVGVRDSSPFNYHLEELLEGGFTEKVDERYGIRDAGGR